MCMWEVEIAEKTTQCLQNEISILGSAINNKEKDLKYGHIRFYYKHFF